MTETNLINLPVIADALAALGHETRLKTVLFIAERPNTPVGARMLCEYLKIPHNKLNFHTAKLKETNLLKSRRVGREIYFDLNIELLDQVLRLLMRDCLQVHDIRYRVSRPAAGQRQEVSPRP